MIWVTSRKRVSAQYQPSAGGEQCHQQAAAIRLQGFDIRKRRLSILGLGGQPDSKADIVDDHQDLVGKLKAEF
jgi:hypothetical protein